MKHRRSVAVVLSMVLVAACSSEAPDQAAAPANSSAASETTRQVVPAAPASTSLEPNVGASTGSTPSATTEALVTTTLVAATEISVAPASAPPSCLAALDERDKAALLVWPSVYSNDWATAVSVVNEYGVGGVILMRPRLSADALRSQIDQLDAASDLGVLVATDEEGGDVQRLVDIEPLASQAEISSSLSPDDAYKTIATHAVVVAGLGVDVVLGPVVDVLPVDGPPPLQRSRFFEGDPMVVSNYAQEYVDGWKSAGLLPVLKHFPGHGSASGDTHTAAGLTPPIEVLAESDVIPYRRLVETGAGVMLGHLTVPGLTEGLPASTSARAISYLRDELGYHDALVMTDALDMAAAGGPIPETAVMALIAGADVLLFTSIGETGAVINAILSALDTGQLSHERLSDAAGRVLALLEERGHGCAR